jgi:hypothetical protein
LSWADGPDTDSVRPADADRTDLRRLVRAAPVDELTWALWRTTRPACRSCDRGRVMAERDHLRCWRCGWTATRWRLERAVLEDVDAAARLARWSRQWTVAA